MNLGIKHLSQYITPSTSGIIWITDEALDYKTPGVYEFNYLLDGMLIKTISQKNETESSSSKSDFFMGNNFGNPLFIAHIVVTKKDDITLMHNHLNIASSLIKKDSTVYVFNRSKNTANVNILKELSAKYKQYNFENLNI